MAKKFVRSITGIKNIKDQDLSTNNVGDLLSDGKDIYVHRKNGTKEEYYNLTTNPIADGDSGLEIWRSEGETNNRIKLSQEFLKNNAQYISAKENSGLKATPRQDKYGKSYELDFTDEAKAKMQDIVDKVNKIPEAKQPIFKRKTVSSVAGHVKAQLTYMAVPYGDSNYIGTVSIIVDASTSYEETVPLSKTDEFAKIISTLNLPSNHGNIQSGGVQISENEDGSINIDTDAKMRSATEKLVGQFPVVTSAI